LELKETLRYIGEADSLALASLEDDEAAEAKLEAAGFARLDTALLHRPEYTANASLRDLVTRGPKSSYSYLLDLRERDLLKKSAALRQARLDERLREAGVIASQLAERPTPGASVWRSEIKAFVELVKSPR
jgi:hypothetical protein